MSLFPQPNTLLNLELIARQVVEGFIIGLHKSPFHGFSVEFAEHRLYNSGDNLKHVDWKVFGRSNKMFVKKFEEETNLRCCIAVDISGSMFFPETVPNKLQYSCVAAASLLTLLKKQMDADALALFSDGLSELSPARSGSRHYRQLMTTLEQTYSLPNAHQRTNAAAALHELAERVHQRSLIIIFSDLPDNPSDTDELFSALQHLRFNKHEVLLFHVYDGQKEWAFTYENRPYEFVDLETGEKLKLNPSEIKEAYLAQMKAAKTRLAQKCLQYHIDLVDCDLSEPVEQVLYRYLMKRNKMM